jgi:hypothetical protein
LGLLLKCHVGAANQADVKAAPWALFAVLDKYERLAKFWQINPIEAALAKILRLFMELCLRFRSMKAKDLSPRKCDGLWNGPGRGWIIPVV